MADTKLTDLTAITVAADGDSIYLADVSDTTDDAAGSSKEITIANLKTSMMPWMSDLWGASETVMTIPAAGLGTKMSFGVTSGGFTMHRKDTASAFSISGGDAGDDGSSLSLFGSTSASASDWGIHVNGTAAADYQIFWDESAGSLSIDTGTGTKVDNLVLSNDKCQFGRANTQYVFNHQDTDSQVLFSGGSSGALGANFFLAGESHATLAGDALFRSGTNTWQAFDESAGTWAIYTDSGTKTLALSIDASQDAILYAGDLDVQAGDILVSGTVDGIKVHGMCFQFAQTNVPADSTTYYYGGNLPVAGAGYNRIYMPRDGTITAVYLTQIISPTLGSAETSTISVRLNNTTDTTITAVFQQDQTLEEFSNTSLSIAVSAGDYIEIKHVTPAWATNPTQQYLSGQIILE